MSMDPISSHLTFSARHRSLRSPDILGLIFTFIDHKSARQCTLVCRAWGQLALEAFRRNLDDPTDFAKALLQHLVPKRRECKCNDWYRNRIHLHPFEQPSSEDWTKFCLRSQQVRSITVSPKAIVKDVSEDVLEVLASRVATVGHFLPKLRAIRLELSDLRLLENPMDLAKIFLWNGIREVTLVYGDHWVGVEEPHVVSQSESSGARVAYRLLLKVATTVAENITHLTVEVPAYSGVSTIKGHLQRVLPYFHNLEQFATSSNLLLVLQVVLTMETLKRLTAVVTVEGRKYLLNVLDRPRNSGDRAEEAVGSNSRFPSLKYMQLSGSMSDISLLFNDQRGFPKLKSVQLFIPYRNTSDARDVAKLVSTRCIRLEELTIVRSGILSSNTPPETNPRTENTRLTTLKICRTEYLNGNLNDLLQHFPYLKSLSVHSQNGEADTIFGPIASPTSDAYFNDFQGDPDEEDEDDGWDEEEGVPIPLAPARLRPPEKKGLDLFVLLSLTHIPNRLQSLSIQVQSLDLIRMRSLPSAGVGPHLALLRNLTLASPPKPLLRDRDTLLGIARFLSVVLPPGCEVNTSGHTDKEAEDVWVAIQHNLQALRLFSNDKGIFAGLWSFIQRLEH